MIYFLDQSIQSLENIVFLEVIEKFFVLLKNLWHSPHLDQLLIKVIFVSIPGDGVVLVDNVTPEVFEIETEGDDELGDDVAEEGHGEVEGDDPDRHHGAEDDLLRLGVAVEEGEVDVGQEEPEDEADKPHVEHPHRLFLWG